MLSYKFNSLLVLFSLIFPMSLLASGFSDKDCLNSNFETEVSHKGKPFGMTKTVLKLEKNGCVVTLHHEAMMMKKGWVLDVCRGPVHIKTKNDDVYKREAGCAGAGSSSYCSTVKKIKTILQDDGLIFAAGEKENIGTDHGKVYCSFVLLNSYLDKGMVFSRHRDYPEKFIYREGESAPVVQKMAVQVDGPMSPVQPAAVENQNKKIEATSYSDQPSGVTDPAASTGSF